MIISFNNSKKHRSSQVIFKIEDVNNGVIEISAIDNGRGLSNDLFEPDRIFEKGVTTTRGSGLGLYHSRKQIEGMGGGNYFKSCPAQKRFKFNYKVKENMKLEYNILWFDDQFEEIEEHIDEVSGFISESGFKPVIARREHISSNEIDDLADKLDNYNPYDLIVFDYDLGADSADGASIANSLRSKIFTDMVFYSGKKPNDLRRILFEKDVDGVFIVHRNSFQDDMELILEDHIKKMSDLNNIRGVVMSEMSSVDIEMRELLSDIVGSLDSQEKKEVFEKLKGKLIKDAERQVRKITDEDDLLNLINNHFLTSFNIVRLFLRDSFESKTETRAYFEDNESLHKMQNQRNNLAHQKEELTDDGRMLLHGKEIVEYTFESFEKIRHDLLNINSKISLIRENN